MMIDKLTLRAIFINSLFNQQSLDTSSIPSLATVYQQLMRSLNRTVIFIRRHLLSTGIRGDAYEWTWTGDGAAAAIVAVIK